MKFQGYVLILLLIFSSGIADADVVIPRELSFKSRECFKCHREKTLVITQQWGASKHYRSNVGCYECHKAAKDDPDVIEHYDEYISIIVSPADCARCHEKDSSSKDLMRRRLS